MQIQQFIELFKQKIDELLDSGIIVPSKKDELFHPGDWTFLINCAIYEMVKEFNQKNNSNLAICAEPEANKTPKGRGGYSDILICSNDGKKEYIMIEHENRPYKKLLEIIKKLSISKAKHKLIITYHSDYPRNYSKKKIIEELKEYTKQYFKDNEILHVLISNYKTVCGDDYEYEQIQNEMQSMQ